MSRARVAAVGALAVGVAAVVVVLAAGPDRCHPLGLSEWRPSPVDAGADATAHAIVECRALATRSRAQVRALLGPPSRRARGSRRDDRAPGATWYYAVGQVGYVLADEQSLVVEFGADGRVREASMAR